MSVFTTLLPCRHRFSPVGTLSLSYYGHIPGKPVTNQCIDLEQISLNFVSASFLVCIIIIQEKIYSSHGKHAREAMFYNVCGSPIALFEYAVWNLSSFRFFQHALPLPGFLLLAPDIWNKIQVYSTSGDFDPKPLRLYSLVLAVVMWESKREWWEGGGVRVWGVRGREEGGDITYNFSPPQPQSHLALCLYLACGSIY